ncbi:MAG: hypothetical protein E6G10_17660 [Actinobacteria bacterium]|nr:MAG: hypothetical protein E6G10_17660 [Actinomycetota bacterium]
MKVLTTRPIARSARTVLAAAGACAAVGLPAAAPAAQAHPVPSANPIGLSCPAPGEPTRHFMPVDLPIVIDAPVPCLVPGIMPMPGYPAGDGTS